jgi:hypothetical protein
MRRLLLAATAAVCVAGCGRRIRKCRDYYPVRADRRVYSYSHVRSGRDRAEGKLTIEHQAVCEPTPARKAYAVRGRMSYEIKLTGSLAGKEGERVIRRQNSAFKSSMPAKWMADPGEIAMFWAKLLWGAGLMGNREGRTIRMFSSFMAVSWSESDSPPTRLSVVGRFFRARDLWGTYTFELERGRGLVGVSGKCADGSAVELKLVELTPEP